MNTQDALTRRSQVEDFIRRHRSALVTMLFSDIVGSTKLKRTLGDREALNAISRHNTVFRETLSRFNEGEEISTAGDAFFIVFTKPSDAVKFSLLVQAGLRRLAKETGQAIFDRIGIHVGEVWMTHTATPGKVKDLYGVEVDTCARVASLGGADQILLTRFAFDNARQVLKHEDVPELGPLKWHNYDRYVAKGLEDEPLEVCEVGEDGKAALTPPADTEKMWRLISLDGEPVLGWRPAVDQPVPGTSWVLEKKLGEGGFGEVWLGRDKILKTRHVFKFCFRADRVRSLKREVTLFRLLKQRVGVHPGIVGVEATYFDEAPFYIVLEYVDGSDLARWCEVQGGINKVPLTARLEIVAQAADALQAAHDSGVIHRDVKPTNILVSGNENSRIHVHLTDFGISTVVSKEVLAGLTPAGFTNPTMESPSSHGGTHLYMAPELFEGKPCSTRSDIYALGVVLYQLLTGDLTRSVATDWATQIADPLLRDDLGRCFAGHPSKRFAGAEQLAGRLRSLEARRIALTQQRALATAKEQAAYRRGVMRTAAVAVAVVTAMALLAVYAFRQASSARRSAKAEAIQRDKAQLETKKAMEATTVARKNLSESDFLQALRSIDEDSDQDALAQLTRSLFLNAGNEAALCRIVTLLGYHGIGLPILSLKHDRIYSAQFSPDGKRIVTASDDKTALVRDAYTGKPLTEWLRHDGWILSAQFSPDGKRIVTASDDKTARVWDAHTGKPLTEPLQHDAVVNGARFSPDGERIVTRWSHSARVWDAHNGKPLSAPFNHEWGMIASAEFSPDGKRIVTAGEDDCAQVWNPDSGKPLTNPLAHAGFVNTAQFSPDGKWIVTASGDETARVWDAFSGQPLTDPLKHDGEVDSAEFSPDGKRIVTASYDGTARIWDAQSGKFLISVLARDGFGSARFSPDGRRIVTASGDTTARVWDAQSGRPVTNPLKHGGEVSLAQFSPDGKRIITASADNTARVWEVQDSIPLFEALTRPTDVPVGDGRLPVPPLPWRVKLTWSAQFSRDGRRIVTSRDKTAHISDVQSGKRLTDPLRHDGIVTSVQLSPDGNRVVTASEDDTARVWDAHNGKPLTDPLKHDGPVAFAHFGPDGSRVVTASEDHTARVWDARSGKPLTDPLKHDGPVAFAHFSPDGSRVVTASEDHTARVWDARSGKPLTDPLGHHNEVVSAQFSPDGRWIVTASGDNTARVWDAQSGEPVTDVLRHQGRVESAQFSPDGKRIVTASHDKTARIWEASTGKPLTDALKHGGEVSSAQFSRDGTRIVTSSNNGAARVWDSQTGKPLIEWFGYGARGNLWAQFSPDGKWIVTVSFDGNAVVWGLLPLGPPPEWLPRLAEAVAGQHLNENGVFEAPSKDPILVLEEIREELSRAPANDDWAIWGRWFLADRSTRTISPFSKITVPEYIENRIKESTANSLDEAERLTFGNVELLQRIASARAELNKRKRFD